MNVEEVSRVVAKVKLGDNREVNELVILEWWDSIGDLAFDEAIEAVRMHRKTSTDYLLPAHIVANVRLLHRRQERAERIQRQLQRAALPAPKITLDRAEFDRWTQEAIEAARAEKAAS